MTRQPPRSDSGPTAPDPATASPGTHRAPPLPSGSRESRYRRRRSPRSTVQDPQANRVLRPTLTEPDTAPMTADQHEQAVTVLAAMIVAWWQRRALDEHTPPPQP